MKKIIYFLISALLLSFSCSEKDEDPINVTYEVITEDGAFWSGEFIDENGERIITFSLNEYFSESGGHRMPSGWKYTFSPKVQPIELLIAAGTTCIPCLDGEAGAIRPSITSNIFINDQLVWTETDNCRDCTATNLKGIATSWFKFPEEWRNGN